jgi:hypothetical protein
VSETARMIRLLETMISLSAIAFIALAVEKLWQ